MNLFRFALIDLVQRGAYGSKGQKQNVEHRDQEQEAKAQVEKKGSSQALKPIFERNLLPGGGKIRVIPGQKNDGNRRGDNGYNRSQRRQPADDDQQH